MSEDKSKWKKCEDCGEVGPPHLCYPQREFNIECEFCGKNMKIYEGELEVLSGDNFEGHKVCYDCKNCGKTNTWQGFV